MPAKATLIEQHHIAPIPPEARTGNSRGIFAIWFGINMLPLTVVTGAVATSVFDLSVLWGVLAIVAGNLVGGVFMALHAAQGPQLGVPQMLQARAQFGYQGATLVVLIAMVMFLGFFASNLVVAGQSIHQVVPALGVNSAIMICAGIAVVVAVVGYRWVRNSMSIMAYLVGATVLLAFVVVLANYEVIAAADHGRFSLAGFFGMFAVGAVWQLAYAPYVSDYSRYLPAATGAKPAFWATYAGCVASSVVVMTLGALVGITATDGDIMAALNRILGAVGPVVLLAFGLSSAVMNAANIYSGVMSALTAVQTLVPRWRIGTGLRIGMTVLYGLVALSIAVAGQDSFLLYFKDFILFLLYVLVPWSAINLVDYYLVRHGSYAIDDLFRRDGGRYGRWNVAACVVYVIGVLVQLPFMVTSFYTGPLAEPLAFVDIAWVLGLVVSGGVYYLWCLKKNGVRPTAEQTQAVATHA